MSLQTILSNFALILFVLMIVTGVIWFLDTFHLSKQRRKVAQEELATFDLRQEQLLSEGIMPDEGAREAFRKKLLKQPIWIEYSGSFFPVIAAVFFLRSFLFEPFKIPSSSMLPTLEIGDLILVSKYSYGIRLPIVNKKIISISDPKRGDLVVFKYPRDPSLDYIKRVIGVGGDRIVYRNKQLTVNDDVATYTRLSDYLDTERLSYSKQFAERVGPLDRRVLVDDGAPSYVPNPDLFLHRGMCKYNTDGFVCNVPQGYYFMLGDNRDNSLDSRYWGFVPDDYIVGKAFFVWMNLGNMGRIGRIQ